MSTTKINQKNGLYAFFLRHRRQRAVAGQIKVSAGSDKICSRTFCLARSHDWLPRPMDPAKIASPTIGHVRRVLLPVADDISHAVFGVAGRLAVRHTQSAEMDDFRGLVALVHRRVFGAAVQPRLRPRLADFRQRLDVIPMRVRDENVPELKRSAAMESRIGLASSPVSNSAASRVTSSQTR